MEIVRKKYIFIFLLLIELTSLFLMYKSNQNKKIILDNVSLKENLEKKDMFAIMIEQDDGTYAESNESEWPTDRVFNVDESGCIDTNGNKLSNVLSYDSTTQVATVDTDNTTFCYLYFSFPIPDIKINNFDLAKLNTGKYIKSVDCGTTGSATFDTKYQRLEFNSITAPAECNINYTEDTTSYPTLLSEIESSATEIKIINNESEEETSYRYTGKQPNNYVWFNNELWRIIGSIPVCMNADCSTKENLVKIIRNDSIGGLVFHSSNANTIWGGTGNNDINTLYTLLNAYYYGKGNATYSSTLTSTPCLGYSTSSYALCNYTENGISDDTTDYYSKMIKDVYWNVGTVSSTSTTIADSYGLETATVSSVSSKIGLMSASDYGYASGQTTVKLSSLSSHTKTNWMYVQGSEWTITPISTSSVVFVSTLGTVNNSSAYVGQAVRPVLYLDSSVYVISGEGTQASPYMIGM